MIDSQVKRRGTVRRRAHGRGIALPIVLLLASMMLATSAAWFEQSVAAARNAAGMYDHLLAFHAADAALRACARNVIDGSVPAMPDVAGEPAGWKLQTTFESSAIVPFASWHANLSFRVPRCLVEGWRLTNRADAHAYLVTARGYGRNVDSQMWLQLQIVIDGGTVEKHWRRVAARPF